MRVGDADPVPPALRGVRVTWLTLIQEWDPPHRFVDVQVRGPYALWHHTHEFERASGDGATLMRDTVRYAIGFGPLGALAHARVRAPRRRGDLRLPPRRGALEQLRRRRPASASKMRLTPGSSPG